MNIEALLKIIDAFIARIMNDPVELGLLMGATILLHFILRKITGRSSRENWYKATLLKTRKKTQAITEEEERFLRNRFISAWVTNLVPLLLLLSLPFTIDYLLDAAYQYGPVLLDNWYVLIALYVLYKVILMLNSLLNLKLLSKDLDKARNNDS